MFHLSPAEFFKHEVMLVMFLELCSYICDNYANTISHLYLGTLRNSFVFTSLMKQQEQM